MNRTRYVLNDQKRIAERAEARIEAEVRAGTHTNAISGQSESRTDRASTLRGARNTNMRHARDFRAEAVKASTPYDRGSFIRSMRARVRRAREFNHQLVRMLVASHELRRAVTL